MKWSKYGLLFASKRNGWLLYHSASNSFIQVEDTAVPTIREIMSHPDTYDYADSVELYFHLRNGGFLVEDTQDEDLVNIIRMRRLTANYANTTLSLTIAPTRVCNFACPYCYEGNRTASMMSTETEDKLIRFIERHKSTNKMMIVWYGGEPLLAFPRIKSLNAKIKKLGKEYTSMIVTNGYCLTEEVISELAKLQTKYIQITLDGGRKTHNKRRFLIGGGETFDMILGNLDRLMASEWKGEVQLRVNVDFSNQEDFVDVYHLIRERYPDKYGEHITVYPGFVHDDAHPDTGCCFNADDKGRFLKELAEKHNITALRVFPRMMMGGCTMTRRNAYVIGPEGELYKCWNDIGDEKATIGTLDSLDWNMSLVAEGMTGCSYLDSKECKNCFFFPICDGGCQKARLLSKRDGQKRSFCSYFKSHLKELLEIHYEQKQSASDGTL